MPIRTSSLPTQLRITVLHYLFKFIYQTKKIGKLDFIMSFIHSLGSKSLTNATTPHLMLRRFRSQHIEKFTLPVGRYRTALDVVEGLFQCTNKASTPWHLNIAIDNEWNITITSQDVWIMVTAPVAQALGWINSANKPREVDTMGVKMNPSLVNDFGYTWCVLPIRKSITFRGTYEMPQTVSLCRCKHRVVQVHTNLIEPWQVGVTRLSLLHEMVPHGSFRQTVMEQPEHIIYLPLRTKTFQTIDIYLTSGCGQPISFQGGTVNVELHFRRRTR
ncbi:hypothetical protein ABFA07_008758 [Porites harrisoni]